MFGPNKVASESLFRQKPHFNFISPPGWPWLSFKWEKGSRLFSVRPIKNKNTERNSLEENNSFIQQMQIWLNKWGQNDMFDNSTQLIVDNLKWVIKN